MNNRICKGLLTGATAWLFGLSVILLASCSGEDPDVEAVTSLNDDSSTAVADASPPEVEDASTAVADEPPPDELETPTAVPSDSAQPDSAPFVPDATLLAEESAPIEPGTYRVNTLGTPLSFTVDDPSFVQPNSHGWFVLTAPGSGGPDDRDIVFFRLSHLVDPSDPTMAISAETFFETAWPSDDFGGWLDNLSADVVVSDRVETTLGGRDAIRADLELGAETTCGPGTLDCALLGTNLLYVRKYMTPGSKYRAWIVDQEGLDPLAIVVGINRDADLAWFDTAEALLSTMAFGDIGPNTVEYASRGPIEEATFLGGIRADLAEEGMRFREPLARISVLDTPAEIAFFSNPLDLDGVPLTTADQLVVALESVDAVVTEVEPVTMGGLDARVFDFGVSSWRPGLKVLPGTEAIWEVPPRARGWVVDHPDRGLLMIVAEAYSDIDEVFPVVLSHAEAIVASLEFVDLGGDDGPAAPELNGTTENAAPPEPEDDATHTDSEPEPEAEAEADPDDLIGTWSTSGAGTWEIVDGETITITGGFVEEQRYSATSTTIELTDSDCGRSQLGRYSWAVVEDVLTLTLISDDCAGRGAVLDGITARRQ